MCGRVISPLAVVHCARSDGRERGVQRRKGREWSLGEKLVVDRGKLHAAAKASGLDDEVDEDLAVIWW